MPGIFQSPQAERDLDEIWEYVAKDSEDAANRLIDRLIDKCRLLASQPEMGQRRPDLAPGLRAFSAGNYVIFYLPVEGGIEIARVIHGARDVGRLL